MKQKGFSSIFAFIMGGWSMIFSGSACNHKEKITYDLSITEFHTPVSLAEYPIEAYLKANPDILVSEFLLKDTTRLDKGAPVVLDYTLESSAPMDVKSVTVEFSFQKDNNS